MPRKMPSTEPNHAETAKALILWARQNRIAISQLVVGDVSIVMHDRRLDRDLVEDATSAEPATPARQSIYEQYGASLLGGEHAPSAETVEPTIEDDDE